MENITIGIYYKFIDNKSVDLFKIKYNNNIESMFYVEALPTNTDYDTDIIFEIFDSLDFINRDNGRIVSYTERVNVEELLYTYINFYSNEYSGIKEYSNDNN